MSRRSVRAHRVEEEIVDDQDIDSDEPSQLRLARMLESRVFEHLEEAICSEHERWVAATACNVGESLCEEGLAGADAPTIGHADAPRRIAMRQARRRASCHS